MSLRTPRFLSSFLNDQISQTIVFFLAGYTLIVMSLLGLSASLPQPEAWEMLIMITSIVALVPVALALLNSPRWLLKIAALMIGSLSLYWLMTIDPFEGPASPSDPNDILMILFDAGWFSVLWLFAVTAVVVWLSLALTIYNKLREWNSGLIDTIKFFAAVVAIMLIAIHIPDIRRMYIESGEWGDVVEVVDGE